MAQEDFTAFTEAGCEINVRGLDLANLAKSSPLEGVEQQARFQTWETGGYWYTSFSDMYRMLVIYELGGIYLDSDVIVTKPFHDLDNVVGWESENVVNCAVLIFKKPRNTFMLDCLLELNATFSSTDYWGCNGPHLVTRIWRRYWAERADAADSIRVLSQNYFYMFAPNKIGHCFQNDATQSEMLVYARALAGSGPYAVHTNNAITGHGDLTLQKGTMCHYLYTRFCVLCDREPILPASYPAIETQTATFTLP